MYCSLAVTDRAYAEAEGKSIRISADGKIMHDLAIHFPLDVDPEKAKQAADALNAAFQSAKQTA